MKSQNVPCLIYQDRYNMFNRKPEREHFALTEKNGVGFIAFSPLAQGLLTNKYLHEIPEKSRAARNEFLKKEQITQETVNKISRLNDLAESRGQTLAQMSLAWVLNHKEVASVIVGSSSVKQLGDNLKVCNSLSFNGEELQLIDNICI
jgi:L-glyceraldehyde 3-phosphate reductase